jgi:DNA-binding SARP family transcriptional activator/Tfp pilus assembly protein PilF
VAVLGYLAAERRLVARDHLAVLFWPDEVPSKARANLRRELYNLSKILPNCWHLERSAVAFVPSKTTLVDIYQLDELEDERSWEETANLLGGEFLEGIHLDQNQEFENWLHAERERWLSCSEDILIHAIKDLTLRGQHDAALEYSQRLVQLTPWNETAYRWVIQLLAWNGQQGAALRQFELCKHSLWEHLAVEPSTDTIALYQQIRDGNLPSPPHVPAFLTETEARHPFTRSPFVAREDELALLNQLLDLSLSGEGQVFFIAGGPGRGKTALMDAFAQRAMETYPELLIANGTCHTYAGMGDPYFPFRDVLAMLTGDVEARWNAGAITRDHAQRLWAVLPLVIQALLDQAPHLVGSLIPGAELLSRVEATDKINDSWFPRLQQQVEQSSLNSLGLEQSYLFQQVTNLLIDVAHKQPILLFLDDMQWADSASIGLLFHLGRRLTEVNSRIMIVCAYRPEEVAVDHTGRRHPLAKLLNEFKRSFGDVFIDLGQVEKTDGRKFVDAFIDSEPNHLSEAFRAALYQRTEGHPLFTVELLRDLRERGDLFIDEQGSMREVEHLDWDCLPARVEAVIEERIERLDPESQEILTIASVEGEAFTAQIVAEVQKMPERLSLGKISQELGKHHRLVSEEGEILTGQKRLSRYRFGHVLFQDYLYNRIGLGERILLHGEVAIALEKFYSGQLDEMAVQIAHHFLKAEDYENSLHYFNLAAERAARIYANDEAINHFSLSLDLAAKISPDDGNAAQIYRSRGLAYQTIGEFDLARADLENALQIAQASQEKQLEWRTLIDLGKLFASRDYDRTLGYFQQALEMARQMNEPAGMAVSLNRMGNWLANDEKPIQAVTYHQEALEIFEQIGNTRDIAITLDLLGIAHLLAGDYNASVKYYDRAIPLFQDLDDRPRLISSLIGRGVIVSLVILLAMIPPDPPPDAGRDFSEATNIAREIGSSPDEAWSSWALGLLHTLRGDFGAALDVVHDGIRIATKIGHREWLVGNLFASGVLYGELLAPNKALDDLERGLSLAEELRSQYWINHLSGAMATAHILQGNLESARHRLDSVLPEGTPMDTKGKRYCWARRAELAFVQGETAQALELIDRLIDTAAGMGPEKVITFLWLLKGKTLAAMGNFEDAEAQLLAAVENIHKTGERFLLWRIHGVLGQLYLKTAHPEKAAEGTVAAGELIEEIAATIPDEDLKQNFRQQAYETL